MRWPLRHEFWSGRFTNADGTHTSRREETWRITGVADDIEFTETMLHPFLDFTSFQLAGLTAAAIDFLEENNPAPAPAAT